MLKQPEDVPSSYGEQQLQISVAPLRNSMKAVEIEKAFSKRKLVDWNSNSFNFENLACTVTSLRETDMLNIIPSLMVYILEKRNEQNAIEYAEMVVFSLMPRQTGWENLVDYMNSEEVSATLKWLGHISDYAFVENCFEELQLATKLFEERVS